MIYIIIITLVVVGFILAAVGILVWVKRNSARTMTNIDAIEMFPLRCEAEVQDPPERKSQIYRKFTAAIEIGLHYSGYGYSTKDETGRVTPVGSSDNAKIVSAMWYNSRTGETKIGYDAQDEFLKYKEKPPEYVSYAADMSFVFDQKETFSPEFAKFVQGLVKAVIGLIGRRHATPNLTEVDFILVVKRFEKMKGRLETMRKYVLDEMMKADIKEDQIKFVMESDCVLQYIKNDRSPTAYHTGAFPTSFPSGNNEKVMILKIGHAAIQCDILHAEGSKTNTKNVFEHFLMWDDNNPEKRFLALLSALFRHLTLNEVKRFYRKFHIELLASLEKLMKNTDETKSITIELPPKLMTTAQYQSKQSSSGIVISPDTNILTIDSNVVKNIIEGIYQNTRLFLSATCTKDRMKGVGSVCLIGGYANNNGIRDIVKGYFQDVPVILPLKPDRIAVMGATACSMEENVP